MSRKSSNGCLVKAILGFVFFPFVVMFGIVFILFAFVVAVIKSDNRHKKRKGGVMCGPGSYRW